MQSRDYFINSSSGGQTTTGGYWEPHSSSIDFCETNYLLSPHVVEPHNVLSSLWGLSLLGVIGMCRGNPTGELRFKVAYGVLGVIGMGSAALHGTLHWVFQSSDELPMIYLVIAGLYCCLENDTKRVAYPWLPHTLVALGIANTLVYFRFQEIYVVFLLTFVSMILAVLVLHVRIARNERMIVLCETPGSVVGSTSTIATGTGTGTIGCGGTGTSVSMSTESRRDNARVALQFYAWHYLVFVGIATPVWILDQMWCDALRPAYDSLPSFLRGCTFHVVWHATAGLGAHTILQFFVACRMSVLGKPCVIRWIAGLVPVVAPIAHVQQQQQHKHKHKADVKRL